MNLAEALEFVERGARVRSNTIPQAAVLKATLVDCSYCQQGQLTGLPGNACENCMNTGVDNSKTAIRVVFEGTDNSYAFVSSEEHEAADWQLVAGWASYG